jgi:hypothetical protein
MGFLREGVHDSTPPRCRPAAPGREARDAPRRIESPEVSVSRSASVPSRERARRRAVAAIRRAFDELSPGAARETARGDRAALSVAGPGKRRLPGLRVDRRAHEVVAATDGRWVQLAYRVGGETRDAETLFVDDPRLEAGVRAFVARHLEAVWWKAPASSVDPPPRTRR